MSGFEEIAALVEAMSAEELAAAGTEAAGATGELAAYGGTEAAGAGLAAGEGAGLTAADYAALQGGAGLAADEGAGLTAADYAGLQGYGASGSGGGLLSDPSSILANDGSGNAFASDYDKYKYALQQGFRNVGKVGGSQAGMMAAKGLLGGGERPQPTSFVHPPSGGGGPPQNSNPYANRQQQLPHATPYAHTLLGNEDSEEMRRRRMMLQRGLLSA